MYHINLNVSGDIVKAFFFFSVILGPAHFVVTLAKRLTNFEQTSNAFRKLKV